MRGLAVLALLCALGVAGVVQAQVLESRSYGLRFVPGQSTMSLSNRITGSETVIYRLDIRSGQIMNVTLSAPGSSAFFIVYGPGQMPGGRSIASSDKTDALVPSRNSFKARMKNSGDHRIEVRLPPQAASRGESAAFTLSVSLDERVPASPDGGSGAVGAGITAQYVQVTGLKPGDGLNVRGGPSTGFAVRYTLRNGEIVRNLGCTPEVGGMMWCRIHRINEPANQGWAAARYLAAARAPGSGVSQLPGMAPVPGSGGGVTQLPGNAVVPGNAYNATGSLACVISGRGQDCPFGVVRRGNGSAVLDITLPNGTLRQIVFSGGRPVSGNTPANIGGEWVGRDVIVTVGTAERYVVVNSVLFGG